MYLIGAFFVQFIYIICIIQFRTAHGQIGLVLLLLVVFQFCSGQMRKAGIENRGNIYFGTNYDKKHQVCMYVCMCQFVCMHVSMCQFVYIQTDTCSLLYCVHAWVLLH